MISEITGELRRVQQDRVQLACGSVTYEILVPASDIPELQAALGQQITFHTIFDLEGDATRGGLTPRLIGFLRSEDKRFFQLFITVKGIGPKRALRALVEPTGQIAGAIESKNTRFLVALPEIGKRTAEQIVAELAGKVTEFALASAPRHPAAASHTMGEIEAIEGAVQLGIARLEAERLLDRAKQADPQNAAPESLLREMLRLRSARA
ncbi:MAG: Holliday junction branch migration protein RuvA [Tepidisphaeraceae bacterium]